MAHYSVIIVGENPDEQMYPFQEDCGYGVYKPEVYNGQGCWDYFYFNTKRGFSLKEGRSGNILSRYSHESHQGVKEDGTVDQCRKCDIADDMDQSDNMCSSILKDGVWYERDGHRHKDDPWPAEFKVIWASIPDDALITLCCYHR